MWTPERRQCSFFSLFVHYITIYVLQLTFIHKVLIYIQYYMVIQVLFLNLINCSFLLSTISLTLPKDLNDFEWIIFDTSLNIVYSRANVWNKRNKCFLSIFNPFCSFCTRPVTDVNMFLRRGIHISSFGLVCQSLFMYYVLK